MDHLFDCENPRLVRNKYTKELIQVPCGHCCSCKVKHITRHVPSLIREASSWKHVFFFTLTYKNRYLPKVNIYSYEVDPKFRKSFDYYVSLSQEYINFHKGNIPVCDVRDVQKFLKRLREKIFRAYGLRNSFRYFISSDYGSTLFRPHWHGILFTGNSRIADNIESLLHESWSIYDKTSHKSDLIGNIKVEPAYSCAEYVSTYTNISSDRPDIYYFRDFKPKCIHSSHPPLGSLVSPMETIQEIVNRGLSTITLYNPKTCVWEKSPLLPNMVYRLFPTIPSFMSLSKSERLEIYRLFYDRFELFAEDRRRDLADLLRQNSFFRDYITLNQDLTWQQLYDKFDRVYYAVKRLHTQCTLFGLSFSDYDSLIESFHCNKQLESLKSQLEYENTYLNAYPDHLDYLLDHVDIARPSNARNLSSLLTYSSDPSDAKRFDSLFFSQRLKKYNKLVKRKCDNAYLDKHPEYKKFHYI